MVAASAERTERYRALWVGGPHGEMRSFESKLATLGIDIVKRASNGWDGRDVIPRECDVALLNADLISHKAADALRTACLRRPDVRLYTVHSFSWARTIGGLEKQGFVPLRVPLEIVAVPTVDTKPLRVPLGSVVDEIKTPAAAKEAVEDAVFQIAMKSARGKAYTGPPLPAVVTADLEGAAPERLDKAAVVAPPEKPRGGRYLGTAREVRDALRVLMLDEPDRWFTSGELVSLLLPQHVYLGSNPSGTVSSAVTDLVKDGDAERKETPGEHKSAATPRWLYRLARTHAPAPPVVVDTPAPPPKPAPALEVPAVQQPKTVDPLDAVLESLRTQHEQARAHVLNATEKFTKARAELDDAIALESRFKNAIAALGGAMFPSTAPVEAAPPAPAIPPVVVVKNSPFKGSNGPLPDPTTGAGLVRAGILDIVRGLNAGDWIRSREVQQLLVKRGVDLGTAPTPLVNNQLRKLTERGEIERREIPGNVQPAGPTNSRFEYRAKRLGNGALTEHGAPLDGNGAHRLRAACFRSAPCLPRFHP